MNIEHWEVKEFIIRFSNSREHEAAMWLEDQGCYGAVEGTDCELMRVLCYEFYEYEPGLPGEVEYRVWKWAKSAALEEKEKSERESEDELF